MFWYGGCVAENRPRNTRDATEDVAQYEQRRLLHIFEGRTIKSLLRFFKMLRKAKVDFQRSIKYVCSDMWQAYLKVIKRKLPNAILLDRYHIVARLNKAIDEIRASEARRLNAEGYEPHLHHTRWCKRWRYIYMVTTPHIFFPFALRKKQGEWKKHRAAIQQSAGRGAGERRARL